MAVIKYKDENGQYQALPYGAIGGSTWSSLADKPFNSYDESTLTVTDGVLTVVGGGTEMSDGDLTSLWEEVFGEDE